VHGRFLPARGVYVTEARVGDRAHPSVTNVGVRPTFEQDGAVTVEAHLLDDGVDLYGEHIALAFLTRLREEMRFQDAGALTEQIRRDVAAAQRYFAKRR